MKSILPNIPVVHLGLIVATLTAPALRRLPGLAQVP